MRNITVARLANQWSAREAFPDHGFSTRRDGYGGATLRDEGFGPWGEKVTSGRR